MIFRREHQQCCVSDCVDVWKYNKSTFLDSAGQLSFEVLKAQADENGVVSIQVELIHKGVYENVPLSSGWIVG
jgi:hypothetical protein